MERGPNPEQPPPRLTRPTDALRAYRRSALALDRQLSQRYPIVELPPAFDLGGEA